MLNSHGVKDEKICGDFMKNIGLNSGRGRKEIEGLSEGQKQKGKQYKSHVESNGFVKKMFIGKIRKFCLDIVFTYCCLVFF